FETPALRLSSDSTSTQPRHGKRPPRQAFLYSPFTHIHSVTTPRPSTMKSIALLAALLLGAASALPTPEDQAAQADAIDYNRRFYCPQRVNAFCHASNVHSGCTYGGEFRSDAMDTCGECYCE
ncbi:Uncharacterized protein TPAR_00197, partial [Tolypocladium paradoxum]